MKESDVTGTTYLRMLLPLLERLHDDGCERDKAGNRRLHFDQSSTLTLLDGEMAATSSSVCRIRDNSGFEGIESRELTERDLATGVLRGQIATNLLDVPAETIAVLDRQRWTIEIFFRFFKHVLGWRVKRNCSPILRNYRHSLRTRDESPREPRIKRQSETG